MRKRVATLTSNVLSPFLVILAVILLLSFQSTTSILEALKWTLILIVLSILPVFLVIVYLVHNDRLEGLFINVRKQRTKIYLLAGVCSGVGCVILPYLGAPKMLVAAFVAGLSASVIFMAINLI